MTAHKAWKLKREAEIKRVAYARACKAKKERAAKKALKEAPILTVSEPGRVVLPRWVLANGKTLIDIGEVREQIVVTVDGRTVANINPTF